MIDIIIIHNFYYYFDQLINLGLSTKSRKKSEFSSVTPAKCGY